VTFAGGPLDSQVQICSDIVITKEIPIYSDYGVARGPGPGVSILSKYIYLSTGTPPDGTIAAAYNFNYVPRSTYTHPQGVGRSINKETVVPVPAAPAPSISSIAPANPQADTATTITFTGFSLLGVSQASWQATSPFSNVTRLIPVVVDSVSQVHHLLNQPLHPILPGVYQVSLDYTIDSTNGQTNSLAYTVIPSSQITITSLTPNTIDHNTLLGATGGFSVVVAGTGFTNLYNTRFSYNGGAIVNTPTATVQSDTSMTVLAPASMGNTVGTWQFFATGPGSTQISNVLNFTVT
jgi:hypothetical protein